MRSGHAPDDVVGGVDMRDPVAHRLVHRVLQRPRPGLDGDHLGAEQPHAVHVQALALDVLGAHVDPALQPETRGHRRRRHAVLPRAGLRNYARLSHPPGEQRLAHGVVDLVSAGMAQVLALEVDLRTAEFGAQALRQVERGRPADVARQVHGQLLLEPFVGAELRIQTGQFVECADQRLGDVPAAVRSEPAVGIRRLVRRPIGLWHVAPPRRTPAPWRRS